MAIGNRKFASNDESALVTGLPRLANTNNDLLTVNFSAIREGYGIQSSISDDANGGYRGYFYLDGVTRVDYLSIERFNVTGTAYADDIRVGNGNDVVNAGAGNDIVYAGYGKDTLDGGAGIDGINKSFLTSTTAVSVNLTTNTITATQGSIKNFEYFSNVIGSSKADVFVSSQFRGNDTVSGGDGNDRAEFKIGYDSFAGGAGNDTLKADFSWMTGNDRVTTAFGVDSQGGFSGYFYLNGGNRASFGTTENFEVIGTRNNDEITTGSGNDILSGGAGNDQIVSGSGTDVLDGGDGIDGVGRDFTTAAAAITIDLAAGTLTGAPGSMVNFEYFLGVTGSAFADTFTTTSLIANDVINGANGDDTASFSGGYDRFTGGLGTDRAIFDFSANTNNNGITGSLSVDSNGGYSGYYYVGANTYRLDFSSIENFTITGTTFDDRITTGDGDDTVRAGAGYDIVNAGGGANTLDGGAGIDGLGLNYINNTATIRIDLGASTIVGIGGSIKNFEYFTSVTTGAGNDALVTTTGIYDDTVITGGGNDTFTTYAGHDRYTAGVGRDKLVMDFSGQDFGGGITYSQTADTDGGYKGYFYINNSAYIEYSSVEQFNLTGTAYADTLVGKEFDDVLNGGAGDDLLIAGSGNDVVDGGAGLDGLGKDMSAIRTAITANLNTSTLTLAGSSFTNIEYFADIRGGSANDTFVTTKDYASDVVTGNAGNDTASFFAGYRDQFDAGSGNADKLIVDYSALDTDSGMGSNSSIDNDNGGNRGAFYVDGNQVSYTGVEILDITGTKNNDSLVGGSGADTLNGGDGRDSLYGNAGNDKLFGGDAGDRLEGGDGNDQLTGGSGSDVLVGGAGRDTFIFANGDSTAGLSYVDQITDFATGVDIIDLTRIDADTGTAGNQAFTFIGNAAFSNVAGQLRTAIFSGIDYVQGDMDGNGTADFTIRVDGDIPIVTDFKL